MTEDEALALWEKEITPRMGDPQAAHSAADDLIVDMLRVLGWGRLADKWEAASSDWWWA